MLIPGCIVLKNKVPKQWAMADIYCQLMQNDDDKNPYYEMYPRIGAFDISYKGTVSYFL